MKLEPIVKSLLDTDLYKFNMNLDWTLSFFF